MRLSINLAAISSNAKRLKEVCDVADIEISGVIKKGYARSPIVRAMESGGIEKFQVSSTCLLNSDALAGLGREKLVIMSPILNEDASKAAKYASGTTVSSVSGFLALKEAMKDSELEHNIFIAIETRDKREGISDLVSFVNEIKSSADICTGLSANFGCTSIEPISNQDLDNILIIINDSERWIISPTTSLGGSILIPEISRLTKFPRPLQLRIGEAIVAGTIPSGKSIDWLSATSKWSARILQSSDDRILIDAGSNVFDKADVQISGDWRLLSVSSECSVWKTTKAEELFIDATVDLKLGYQSLIRALSTGETVNWITKSNEAYQF